MIFTIAPLVQEANTRRRWLATLGLFTAALVVVLGVFGAAVAWAGTTVVATVTGRWAREAIASVALTLIGIMALVVAGGELGVWRPWLPHVTTPPGPGLTSPGRRTLALALGFGATMAIFSPLSTYALMLGSIAARHSAWLGAVTMGAYGLGLMVPLAVAGTLAARRDAATRESLPTWQERVRIVGGASLAVAGGFMLSMWTLRATWALFFPSA
jgi:cytochrome c biogenesis protein CcdA